MNKQSNLEHKQLLCEPVETKDVDMLESMYNVLHATANQAYNCTASLIPIDGTTYNQLAPGVLIVLTPQVPKFKGVALCTHCISRAAMLYRDLANTCDDKSTGVSNSPSAGSTRLRMAQLSGLSTSDTSNGNNA